MFCANCGTPITQDRNYCNRCGARVEKLMATEKSSAAAVSTLSMATGFVGLGGLGLTVGLIAILLKHGVVPEAVVMLALAFLFTTLGITFMMIRQLSQMTKGAQTSNAAFVNPQLNAPNTAQLGEPRQPAMSVTENTTRTLEKESVK